jgi:hypothetical protein
MTYSEMFADQDDQSFEERRDEVVAIVSSALDLVGFDRGLSAIMQSLTTASDEREFDQAFDAIANRVQGTTPALADVV